MWALSLTLADILAVCRVCFILRGHHDVPGGHPGLRLQTEALDAAAERNKNDVRPNCPADSSSICTLKLFFQAFVSFPVHFVMARCRVVTSFGENEKTNLKLSSIFKELRQKNKWLL